MLTKIEALNYRALRYVSQSLEPFQVLIGPNASGKSTFLDVVAFMADLITQPTLADAVLRRSADLQDLTWMRESEWFELAVEARLPDELPTDYSHVRYEIRLGIEEEAGEIALQTESLYLMPKTTNGRVRRQSVHFPDSREPPEQITRGNRRTPQGWRKVVGKVQHGNDYFQSETTRWNNMFRLGPKRSALANLPEDQERFPATIWFKRYISEGVQRIMLNSEALRRASRPQTSLSFLPDGSNLPHVIHRLEQNHPDRLREWINHICTALPDVRNIHTVERPEDRHRYLVLHYASGLAAPSWIVSDGTLRLLALSILAYLPDIEGIYLIEEPENGIHPRAVEAILQSLRSVYDAQVLLATHSPVILSVSDPAEILCFARTEEGAVDIVRGDEHPRLANWRGEINLSTLFASGVLGA